MQTGPVVLTEDEKEQLRDYARRGIIITDSGADSEFQNELNDIADAASKNPDLP